MPNPLPFAAMKEHRLDRRACSPGLRPAGLKGTSVVPVPTTPRCSLVPHASSPRDSPAAEAVDAELLQLPLTGTVDTSFTTIDVGTAGVSVLLITSFFIDSDTRPSGVTGQEQQA